MPTLCNELPQRLLIGIFLSLSSPPRRQYLVGVAAIFDLFILHVSTINELVSSLFLSSPKALMYRTLYACVGWYLFIRAIIISDLHQQLIGLYGRKPILNAALPETSLQAYLMATGVANSYM